MGHKFTWFRRSTGNRIVAKRLDRTLVDVAWQHAFPEASLENLSCMHSDHAPILLMCGGFSVERWV